MESKILSVKVLNNIDIRSEMINDGNGRSLSFATRSYNKDGILIGTADIGTKLDALGVKPVKAQPSHVVCTIGFSELDQKWYGFNESTFHGFGIGDEVRIYDVICGDTKDTLQPGFYAKTLEHAKKMAVAFAIDMNKRWFKDGGELLS